MPSKFSTPSPPSLPSSIATAGETTPSIAEASNGSSSRCGPSFQPMSTSCGSRVRLDGTIAMSSNPYACRAFLPRPISISTPRYLPWMQKGPGAFPIAWAEKPFSLPSLKWTAMVPPSSDDSVSPQVRNAEDVRAVEALHLEAVDVAVADEREAVGADRDRGAPADVAGRVDRDRGGRVAEHVGAVRDLQVLRPARAVVVADHAEPVDAERDRRVLALDPRVHRMRRGGRAGDVGAVGDVQAAADAPVADPAEAVGADRQRGVEADGAGAVEGGAADARAERVGAVGDLQVSVPAVEVADERQPVGAERQRRVRRG